MRLSQLLLKKPLFWLGDPGQLQVLLHNCCCCYDSLFFSSWVLCLGEIQPG